MLTYDPGMEYRNAANPFFDQSMAYGQDQLGRLNQGVAPSWFTKGINPMEQYQRELAFRDMYGPGGQMQQTMDAGALGGLGQRQMMAQTGKLRNNLQDRYSGISDAIT
jgi:hypothetical protein